MMIIACSADPTLLNKAQLSSIMPSITAGTVVTHSTTHLVHTTHLHPHASSFLSLSLFTPCCFPSISPLPFPPKMSCCPAGPSSHDALQSQLSIHLAHLPPDLQARISAAHIICLGPQQQQQQQQQQQGLASEGPEAALASALQQAAVAAAPLLPQLHTVPAPALLQALTVLELRAKLAAATAAAAAGSNGSSGCVDVLSAYVEAHNTGLLSLGNCLEAQLDSTAAAWGYPPTIYSGSSSIDAWQAAAQLLRDAPSLQLPPPPPLYDFLQQQQQQVSAGAAALAQLTSYLDSCGAAEAEGGGGVSAAVAAVAQGVRAILTARLVQQKQLLPSSSSSRSSRASERQLQLVRSHCELLLERLQQQPVLQVMLTIHRGDLQLIQAADSQQQQPGWWQQQQQLLLQGDESSLQVAEQGLHHDDSGDDGTGGWPGGDVLWGEEGGDPTGAAAQQQQQQQLGDAGGDPGGDGSPEAARSTAKQQAAVAAQLLAKCRLKPWMT
jgi:hypothetical protein